MARPSKIVTDFEVDDPIQQDAAVRFDKLDRAYLDNQALGGQQHIFDGLIGPGQGRAGDSIGRGLVQGVAATPGWEVIGSFFYGVKPIRPVKLAAVLVVSKIALTGRVRLFGPIDGPENPVAVAGSTVTTPASPDNINQTRQLSSELKDLLIAQRVYQYQAECTGGALLDDWVNVQPAMLVRG